MLQRYCVLAMVCVAVMSMQAARGADLTLTANEPANVGIVVPEKAEAAYTSAANLLAKRIEQAVGRKVKVVKESEAGKLDLAFQVGPTAASLAAAPEQGTLPPHGYEIKADGKANVYFAAKDDFAVGFAVTEFAERVLNIRQYMPAPLGECITKMDKVVVPGDFNYVSKPDYASVWISGVAVSGERNDQKYKQMDLAYQVNWSDKFHHAMHDIFPPEKYAKDHPEYYPERNGKRLVPLDSAGKSVNGGWQPCFTNQEVRRIVLEHCLEFFKQNPSNTSVSIAINDGGGYCQCDKCLAMEKKYNGFSGVYFDFANQVARELDKQMPGKKIGFLRYGKVTDPPPFPIEKNILIYYTHPGTDGLVPWVKAGASVGVYTWVYGFNQVTPRYFPHEFARFMKLWKEQGAVGLYAEAYPNWIVDAPMVYMMTKIARHHEVDPDAMLKQYASDMFGPAADDIVKFYKVSEQAMERRKNQTLDGFEALSTIARPIRDQFVCWRVEDVAQMDAALKGAAGKVAPGSIQVQRLELLELWWPWSRAYILAYANAAKVQDQACTSAADVAAMMPYFDQLNANAAEVEKQWTSKMRDLNDPKVAPTKGMYIRSALDPNYWQSVVGCWIDPGVWPYAAFDRKLSSLRESLGKTMKPEEVAGTFRKLAGQYPQAAPYLTTQATLATGKLENLISNPSFEEIDPFESDHKSPTGFKIWMSRSQYQKDVGVVDGVAHSGKRSFHQVRGAGAWLDRTITVEPGARYLVRLWVRQNSTDNDSHMNFLVYDKAGKMVKVIYNGVPGEKINANEWYPMEGIVTIPDNADKLTIDFYSKSHDENEDSWFDDMIVARVY